MFFITYLDTIIEPACDNKIKRPVNKRCYMFYGNVKQPSKVFRRKE